VSCTTRELPTGGPEIEYLIGVILTLAVAAFAAAIGFDRERAFYPTVLIVIASYYALFAVMGASTRTLIIESIVAAVFVRVWLLVTADDTFRISCLREIIHKEMESLNLSPNRIQNALAFKRS
jgi:hypothetical protein